MGTVFDESAGDTGTPAGSPTAFCDFIEERYQEWEREFGEEVHLRRKVTLDPT
jgi:MOSC domain-containing protein YiiM